LDAARDAIAERDEAILVEGYFDVLALHDVGVRNVVGVMGVGVVTEQLELAARFSPSRRVVLALDADAAGAAAVKRLCEDVFPELAEAAGVDAHVAAFSDAKDAADFVADRRGRGHVDGAIADEARKLFDAATPWADVCHLQPAAEASVVESVTVELAPDGKRLETAR